MAQACSICTHAQRAQIERALVGKVAYRKIGEQFNLHIATISRHKAHIPEALLGEARAARNQEDSELAKATDKLLAEIRQMQRRLRVSRKRNTIEVADLLLKISREIRALLELRSRIAGPRSPALEPVTTRGNGT
jgi:IS30 family transposase